MTHLHFTAAEAAHDCKGCIFEHEHSRECRAAEAVARDLALPMCEDQAPGGNGYIYIFDKTDPRQMRIIQGMT